MSHTVRSTLRIIRAYGKHEGGERVQALREEAAKHPQGTAAYVLAVVLWEEGQIDEANLLAQAFLEESPGDFNMLVIGLDYQIRANNSSAILDLARRVAAARRPSAFRKVRNVLARPWIWRAQLFGGGPKIRTYSDANDEWAAWARLYVAQNSPAVVEPDKSRGAGA